MVQVSKKGGICGFTSQEQDKTEEHNLNYVSISSQVTSNRYFYGREFVIVPIGSGKRDSNSSENIKKVRFLSLMDYQS